MSSGWVSGKGLAGETFLGASAARKGVSSRSMSAVGVCGSAGAGVGCVTSSFSAGTLAGSVGCATGWELADEAVALSACFTARPGAAGALPVDGKVSSEIQIVRFWYFARFVSALSVSTSMGVLAGGVWGTAA